MCVPKRGTPAARAIRRTTLDQVQGVNGSAWLRRDFRQEQRPARSTDPGTMPKVGAQEFAADGRVWHHSLAPALGGLRADAQQSVPRVDVVGAQAAQLLSPKARVIGEGQHHAVADRLAPSCIEDRPPVCLIRDPGQPDLMRNQAPAIATHAGAGCVTAPTDRVGVSHAFLDKVIIEQANSGEPLLYGSIGQPRAGDRRGRRVRASAPRRPLGEFTDVAGDVIASSSQRVGRCCRTEHQVFRKAPRVGVERARGETEVRPNAQPGECRRHGGQCWPAILQRHG